MDKDWTYKLDEMGFDCPWLWQSEIIFEPEFDVKTYLRPEGLEYKKRVMDLIPDGEHPVFMKVINQLFTVPMEGEEINKYVFTFIRRYLANTYWDTEAYPDYDIEKEYDFWIKKNIDICKRMEMVK